MNIAATESGQKIIQLFKVEEFGNLFVSKVVDAQAVEFAFQKATAGVDVLFIILLLEPAPNFFARACRFDKAQLGGEPVAAGAAPLGGDDFDLVAGFERGTQGDEFSVDLGPPATLAHNSMNVIGKVDGGGTLWQIDNIATRGKGIYPILKDIGLEGFDKLAAFGKVVL